MKKIEKWILVIIAFVFIAGSSIAVFYGYRNTFNNYTDYEYEDPFGIDTPSTEIKDGNIYWYFKDLDGNILTWYVDISTYQQAITWPDPTDKHLLEIPDTDETYYIANLSGYVQPNFFSNVISGLAQGKSDKQFVSEVINLKNQLVSYNTGLTGEYRWPAETLTEGGGNCADTSILVASLLKAGEEVRNYGLNVYFWYCDSDHMNNPQDINHVIVEVEYKDGTNQLIETTSDTYYTYDQIYGWKFKV